MTGAVLGTAYFSLLAQETTKRDGEVDESRPISVEDSPPAEEPQNQKLAYKFVSAEGFDPAPGKAFLVAFTLRFNQLPKEQERQKIVFKYRTEKPPYPGWAFGVRRSSGVIRPQLYWQPVNGGGGWFTFEQFPFVDNQLYTFIVLARPGEYLSLYVEKVTPAPKQTGFLQAPAPSVEFAGGYSLASIGTPATSAPLGVGSESSRSGPRNEVQELLVAHPETSPASIDEAKAWLDGGIEAITKRIGENNIMLWLKDGRDHSRFNRQPS